MFTATGNQLSAFSSRAARLLAAALLLLAASPALPAQPATDTASPAPANSSSLAYQPAPHASPLAPASAQNPATPPPAAGVMTVPPPPLPWTPEETAQFDLALPASQPIEALRSLLAAHGGLTPLDSMQQPVFLSLVVRNDLPLVQRLLDAGADIADTVKKPVSDAWKAPFADRTFMEYYFRHDDNFDALMLASILGHTDMVALLRARGAKQNLTASSRTAAIQFAAKIHNTDIQQILLGVPPGDRTWEIKISLTNQEAILYNLGAEKQRTKISTGRKGHETPTGMFVVTDKDKDWTSNLYHASMPHFMRLSCSAVGLHAGNVPDYPASHGCIRLPKKTAKEFFDQVPLGTIAEISP